MRTIVLSIVMMSAASSAFAQQWEFGAMGGGGFLSNVSANGGPSATLLPVSRPAPPSAHSSATVSTAI